MRPTSGETAWARGCSRGRLRTACGTLWHLGGLFASESGPQSAGKPMANVGCRDGMSTNIPVHIGCRSSRGAGVQIATIGALVVAACSGFRPRLWQPRMLLFPFASEPSLRHSRWHCSG